jgi:hypothetical protein
LEREFAGWYVRWHNEQFSGAPIAPEKDRRAYRRGVMGTILALITEVLLAVALFTQLGVPTWVAVFGTAVSSALVGMGLHIGLNISATLRPRLQYHRLRILSMGSFAFLVIGIGFWICIRFVTGDIAVAAISLWQPVLGVVALSLIVLSATVGVVTELFGRTVAIERTYQNLQSEKGLLESWIKELETEETAIAQTMANASRQTGSHASTVGRIAACLMLAAIPSFAGCTHDASVASAGQSQNSPVWTETYDADKPGPWVKCEIDISGSIDALDGTWSHINQQLPALCEYLGATDITVSVFDREGFYATEVASFKLPRPPVSVEEQMPPGEWEVLINLKEASENHEKAKSEERRTTYQNQLAAIAESLSTEHVLPPPGYEAASSDVLGCIQHFAKLKERRPVFGTTWKC